MTLDFHPLTIADRKAVQNISLNSGQRNCNFTFANLIGWQFLFKTEVCLLPDTVLFRFCFNGQRAYMACSVGALSWESVEALRHDSGGNLSLCALDDAAAATLQQQAARHGVKADIEARRDQYDYIYRRTDLATLYGAGLKAKRNHVNRFLAENPGFTYLPLSPDLFGQCRQVASLWRNERVHDNPAFGDTITAEDRVMETLLANWEPLGMTGGCIFLSQRMVAFTFGAMVTNDTIDICIEKADRSVKGSFSIINQQFAQHLPENIIYINREDDMGIAGLRKAKQSYQPAELLSYNVLHIA